jgi:hypothetical protein
MQNTAGFPAQDDEMSMCGMIDLDLPYHHQFVQNEPCTPTHYLEREDATCWRLPLGRTDLIRGSVAGTIYAADKTYVFRPSQPSGWLEVTEVGSGRPTDLPATVDHERGLAFIDLPKGVRPGMAMASYEYDFGKSFMPDDSPKLYREEMGALRGRLDAELAECGRKVYDSVREALHLLTPEERLRLFAEFADDLQRTIRS